MHPKETAIFHLFQVISRGKGGGGIAYESFCLSATKSTTALLLLSLYHILLMHVVSHSQLVF